MRELDYTVGLCYCLYIQSILLLGISIIQSRRSIKASCVIYILYIFIFSLSLCVCLYFILHSRLEASCSIK